MNTHDTRRTRDARNLSRIHPLVNTFFACISKKSTPLVRVTARKRKARGLPAPFVHEK